MRRVSGSSPLSSTIYPVVFRYQEQKPANFAGFLLFWYDFAHFYAENVPIFRAHFRAFLNERKRYLSAFRNCSPNCSIFLSIYIHILDISAPEIGFSLRFLEPFSFSKSLLDLLHWYAAIAAIWRHIFLQFITLCRFCCIQTWMFCSNDQSVSTSPLPRSIIKDVPGLFRVLWKNNSITLII